MFLKRCPKLGAMTAPHPLTPPQRSRIVGAIRSMHRLLAEARSNLKAAQTRLSQLQRQDQPGPSQRIPVGARIFEAAQQDPRSVPGPTRRSTGS